MDKQEKHLPIADFARSLSDQRKDSYEALDWLLWPPDVFLITSILLHRTGCYRIALIEQDNKWLNEWQKNPRTGINTKREGSNGAPDDQDDGKRFYWQSDYWEKEIKEIGAAWINATGYAARAKNMGSWEGVKANMQSDPDLNKAWREKLDRLESLWLAVMQSERSIDELRIISSDSYVSLDLHKSSRKTFSEKAFIECRELAMLLTWIHALADEACMGFGLVSECDTTDLNEYYFTKRIRAFAKMKANLLLISTGSLSTVAKFHGVVLPKMRTPQVGYILRSMSHHLTFHATEVEVIWRTIPWLNAHEKTLNILAFPYPSVISNKDFKAMNEQYHSVRYFQPNFDKDVEESFSMLSSIIKLVIDQHKSGTPIHMIIFPESALQEAQYHYLLKGFHEKLDEDKIPDTFKLPMIIAGVVGLEDASEGKTADHSNTVSSGAQPSYVNNEVRVASYFAGRWYEAKQRKHHRWQLDRKQIIQYDLQGVLTTEKKWFEYNTVSQRRLTFLAPNDWLVITSLICEDLARLEPVSEIIRGVGPTFLMALLSDGPQLTERWSARYASVLADDPGTAVFSLTSYGMASRSKPENSDYHNRLTEDGTVVGLWRDAVTGFKVMKASGPDNAQLITVSAEFDSEKTLDNRDDGGKAPSLKIDKVKEIPFEKVSQDNKYKGNGNEPGNWEDIRQLSVFVFTLDAAIDLLLMTVNNRIVEEKNGQQDKGTLSHRFGDYWEEILSILLMEKGPIKGGKDPYTIKKEVNYPEITKHAFEDILYKTQKSLEEPLRYGVGVKTYYEDTWPAEEVKYAFSMATYIFINAIKEIATIEKPHSVISVMAQLFRHAEKVFYKEQDTMRGNRAGKPNTAEVRIRQAVPIAMVMSIDNKLSNWKLKPATGLPELIKLRTAISKFLNESYKRVRSAK
jgi:hypothetical protein